MEKSQQTKEKIAQYTPVNITQDKKRFCNVCNSELLPDYSCGKCGIYYTPDQPRHEILIRGLDGKMPGELANTIPIASADTSTSPQKPKQKMGADFAALEKSGFKWTSYSESNTAT